MQKVRHRFKEAVFSIKKLKKAIILLILRKKEKKIAGKGIQSFPYTQAKSAMALHIFRPYEAAREKW